jgi:hypothetical protein
MLRPLQFSCPLTTVPLGKALGRTNSNPGMQVPGVMHSVWRADDGSVGAVFVNIAKEPVAIGLSLDFRQQWGLRPGAKPFLYCVKDEKHSLLKADSNSTANIKVAIQPLEIVFIGLCEADGPRAQQVLKQINAGANAGKQLRQLKEPCIPKLLVILLDYPRREHHCGGHGNGINDARAANGVRGIGLATGLDRPKSAMEPQANRPGVVPTLGLG